MVGGAWIIPGAAVANIDVGVEIRILSVGLDAGIGVVMNICVHHAHIAVGIGAVVATHDNPDKTETAHVHVIDAKEVQQPSGAAAIVSEKGIGIAAADGS